MARNPNARMVPPRDGGFSVRAVAGRCRDESLMKPREFGEMMPRVTTHHVARIAGTVAMVVALLQAVHGQANPDPRLPPKPYPPAPRLADGTPNLGPIEPN